MSVSVPNGTPGGSQSCVVAGLLNQRHNLEAARKTAGRWRAEWEAARWFLSADGESGKRFGNETIRVTADGEVSIKVPAPLAGLANASHGRYVLAAPGGLPHRGTEWRDRITTDRAVAYPSTMTWPRAAGTRSDPVLSVDLRPRLWVAVGVVGPDRGLEAIVKGGS
ncbi:MAG: hypothetical protein J2P17_29765 [Mycobacterium sp.]|nr:hypothetical protein [Mycobacterium sp.]